MRVSGNATTETTISELYSSTNYSIQVAAVNSAGTGIYSTAIFTVTKGIMFTSYNIKNGHLFFSYGIHIKTIKPFCSFITIRNYKMDEYIQVIG